jgi:anti-sigma B factor antagonist
MGAEEELNRVITQAVADGQTHLLVNMAEVPFIDSSGIGGLIKSFSRVKGEGGKLKLLNPTHNARQLLSITGLLSVFETFNDETTALSSY